MTNETLSDKREELFKDFMNNRGFFIPHSNTRHWDLSIQRELKDLIEQQDKQAIKRLEEELFKRLMAYNMEVGGLIVREHEKRNLIKEEIDKIMGPRSESREI